MDGRDGVLRVRVANINGSAFQCSLPDLDVRTEGSIGPSPDYAFSRRLRRLDLDGTSIHPDGWRDGIADRSAGK